MKLLGLAVTGAVILITVGTSACFRPDPARMKRWFKAVNGALIVLLLAALCIEHSHFTRGYFTDYFCQLFPTTVPPLGLFLFVYGLIKVRSLRFWILLPLVVLGLAFCFSSTLSLLVVRRVCAGPVGIWPKTA